MLTRRAAERSSAQPSSRHGEVQKGPRVLQGEKYSLENSWQLNNSKHTHMASIYLVTSTSRTEINGRCAAVDSRELSAPSWQLPMSAGQRHWFGRHSCASDTSQPWEIPPRALPSTFLLFLAPPALCLPYPNCCPGSPGLALTLRSWKFLGFAAAN